MLGAAGHTVRWKRASLLLMGPLWERDRGTSGGAAALSCGSYDLVSIKSSFQFLLSDLTSAGLRRK